MLSRTVLGAFLLSSLLACKMVDKVKERIAGDQPAKPGAKAAASPSAAARPPAASSAAPNVVAMTGKFTPLPLKVGQMVRYRGTGASSRGLIYSVVGKERGAFRLEFSSGADSGTTVTQILLRVNEARDPASLKLLEAKVKPPGAPAITFGSDQADMLGKLAQNIIQGITIPNIDHAPREDVTVPAGKFQGALKIQQQEKVLGFASKTTSWHHSSVPITCMVKTVGTINGKPTSLELAEYSLTGAKSQL